MKIKKIFFFLNIRSWSDNYSFATLVDEFSLYNDIIESFFLEVSLNSRFFLVCCCYRPYTITSCEIYTNLSIEKLNNLKLKVKEVVVCGDFNVDHLKIKKNYSSIAIFYDSLQPSASCYQYFISQRVFRSNLFHWLTTFSPIKFLTSKQGF